MRVFPLATHVSGHAHLAVVNPLTEFRATHEEGASTSRGGLDTSRCSSSVASTAALELQALNQTKPPRSSFSSSPLNSFKMIFEPAERRLLPTKDLLSYIFDDPPYDQDQPVSTVLIRAQSREG